MLVHPPDSSLPTFGVRQRTSHTLFLPPPPGSPTCTNPPTRVPLQLCPVSTVATSLPTRVSQARHPPPRVCVVSRVTTGTSPVPSQDSYPEGRRTCPTPTGGGPGRDTRQGPPRSCFFRVRVGGRKGDGLCRGRLVKTPGHTKVPSSLPSCVHEESLRQERDYLPQSAQDDDRWFCLACVGGVPARVLYVSLSGTRELKIHWFTGFVDTLSRDFGGDRSGDAEWFWFVCCHASPSTSVFMETRPRRGTPGASRATPCHHPCETPGRRGD